MPNKFEILQERATKTAIREQKFEDSNVMSVLQFSLYPGIFAIRQTYITDVFTLTEITELPGAPAYVMGVVNRRGRVICIINLKEILQIKSVGLTEMNKIICLKKGESEFGIVADALFGTSTISGLNFSPEALLKNHSKSFIEGVLSNGTIVLNDSLLLDSKDLVVS